MNCIIVEDEPMALKLLTGYAEKVSWLRLKGSFRNALQALEYLQSNNVELVFLDINMPDLSGIQFLKSLKTHPMIIFTTAYSQYALESYDFNTVDYLLKPIAFDRFLKAVNKASDFNKSRDQTPAAPISALPQSPDNIFIKSGVQIIKLGLNEILYFEGNGNYITVVTTTKKILTLMKMKDMLEMLPAGKFMQVHKSYIVSLSNLEIIEKHQVVIAGKEIPISTMYREGFLKLFNK